MLIKAATVSSSVTSICQVCASLNLFNNYLDAEAGKALAGALSVNTALNKLDLRDNSIYDERELRDLVRDSVKVRDGFELLV